MTKFLEWPAGGFAVPRLMTALERAEQLMKTKFVELPPLALAWRNKLVNTYGDWSSVNLCAYVSYAQYVEGLSNPDSNKFPLMSEARVFFDTWINSTVSCYNPPLKGEVTV